MKEFDILNPRFFEEQDEVHIFVEYLFELPINDLIKLAKEINDKNISSLVFQCYNVKNENSTYIPKILDYVDSQSIEKIHIDTIIDLDYLTKFTNLVSIGLSFNNNKKFPLNNFSKLKSITITGYDNNIDLNVPSNIKFLSFWKSKKKIFDYELNIQTLEKLIFMNYNTINLNKIKAKSIKNLTIDNTSNLVFSSDNELFSNVEILDLSNCDLSNFVPSIIKKMTYLKELRLEKCDLSIFSKEIFEMLINLNTLIIDRCRNLNSIDGIHNLDRVVIMDTKIMDNNISPLATCKNVYITRYKTYNEKI